MVTAEVAVALPVLLLVAALLLSGLSLVLDQVRCVDAARAAARELARGEDVGAARVAADRLAPDGADVDVGGGALVRVVVSSRPPPLLGVLGLTRGASGEAVAVREVSDLSG